MNQVFEESMEAEAEAVRAPAPVSRTQESFAKAVQDHLLYTCVKERSETTAQDLYRAMAHSVRDRLVLRWLATQRTYDACGAKRVYYLSSEYLTGRSLGLCLLNLDLLREAEGLARQFGLVLEDVLEHEGDPGLGNGGLGRLAACFMDSLATLELPAVGYGIRYDYGIFEQRIEHGQQVEHRDNWLEQGNPWEVPRHDQMQSVRMYGRVEQQKSADGSIRNEWVDTKTVLGLPFDSFIVGHDTNNVNTLRLWSARAARDFDLQMFNAGDYLRAVEEKVEIENISKVLYPPDHTEEGKELRLKQQYFFVACSLGDVVQRFRKRSLHWSAFPREAAIQLNDTHPAIAVAELMRILLDVEGLDFERAFAITEATLGYTNHTLMPEALERWPLPMFERLLPRHLQIILEINHHFLRKAQLRWPGDVERLRRLSIIEEGPVQQVRMAHLAAVGSHSINGVAKLHSELVKRDLLADFHALFPERFNNKTNGVTPRRWFHYANPRLHALACELLAVTRLPELAALSGLVSHADDPDVLDQVSAIKVANKRRLAREIKARCGVDVDPTSMFLVQVKRIHEYKRQLLACLGIIARYLQIKDDPDAEVVSRTYVFSGKAAATYTVAKQHVRLINDLASVINEDPDVRGRLKVAFVPNYGVSLAQLIIPAADVSLQISLAGKEASGTGNMKLALNGAVTLGTLDGANIEIREAVGHEQFLSFGMSVAEVKVLEAQGYRPSDFVARSPLLTRVIELLDSDFFCLGDRGRHASIVSYLRGPDPFMVCADFDAYEAGEARAAQLFSDRIAWARASLLNTAGAGCFSSDATVAAYAHEIWGLQPVKADLTEAVK